MKLEHLPVKEGARPILIKLVQISSPSHYALWNALSVETLAGDLRGEFLEQVDVKIDRIRSEKEIYNVLEKINCNPPDIIGISVEIGSLEWTNKFLDGYNELNISPIKRSVLNFGNKLPTYFPEYFLEKCPTAVVIIGEGEESLRGLVEHVMWNRSLESIPNLVYKNEHNKLCRTFQKSPDLNSLKHPPTMDTVPEVVQNGGNALIQASRGCSWSQCSYCTIKSFRKGRKWEGFSVQRVLENIERLVSVGVTELEFVDDEFLGEVNSKNIERINDIANGIEKIRNKTEKDVSFRIFMMPHTVYQKGRLKENEIIKNLLMRLKDIGLSKVYFGIESGCLSQLRRYRRIDTIEELEATIRILRDELKIEIDVGFIMFDPDLSLDEIISNVHFFRKWDLIKSNQWPFRSLVITPGSYIYENLKNSGSLFGFDINNMSYRYEFKDQNIQRIFTIVNSLSFPSMSIFYALKVVSKRQFSSKKKDIETILAQSYVEENGEIFLEVIDRLANYFQGNSSDTIEEIIYTTQNRMNSLVMRIQQDIINGAISDHSGFISEQIKKWQNDSMHQRSIN